MELVIRPARMEDHGEIASFTRDTFAWGDYITRVYKDWIADPQGLVLVAADAQDRARAMGKVTLVSPDEAWAQGARVHPDFRRQGLATRLSDELAAWAAEQGAQVIRLAVEDWNEAARSQVLNMGFRPVSRWVMADRALGAASPVPEGNGGRRVRPVDRLRPVPSPEADAAWLAWSSSPLSRLSRGLLALGWTWRRLTVADLRRAARHDALLHGPSGWAMAAPEAATLDVAWVETSLEDARPMVRALVDRAQEANCERIELKVPAAAWLTEPLEGYGFELHPLTVFARGLA